MYFAEDKLITDKVSNSTIFEKSDSIYISDSILIKPYVDITN